MLSRDSVIITANICVITFVLLATLIVPTSSFVAVVMPPGTRPEATVAAVAKAGGSLIAPARVSWIVIAHSGQDDFVSRVRGAGAWFVLNHRILSGCFSGS